MTDVRLGPFPALDDRPQAVEHLQVGLWWAQAITEAPENGAGLVDPPIEIDVGSLFGRCGFLVFTIRFLLFAAGGE